MQVRPGGNVGEPDVFVVLASQLARARSDRLDGPADLVIEVIADESVGRDRVEKFDEYEASGVGEYWILDPRPQRQRASFSVLDARQRFQPVSLEAGDVFRSTALPGFWLKVDWLWPASPSVLQALAEIAGPDRLMALIQGRAQP